MTLPVWQSLQGQWVREHSTRTRHLVVEDLPDDEGRYRPWREIKTLCGRTTRVPRLRALEGDDCEACRQRDALLMDTDEAA